MGDRIQSDPIREIRRSYPIRVHPYLLGILASYDPYTNVYYSFPYLWEGIASYDQRQQFVLESAIASGYV